MIIPLINYVDKIELGMYSTHSAYVEVECLPRLSTTDDKIYLNN